MPVPVSRLRDVVRDTSNNRASDPARRPSIWHASGGWTEELDAASAPHEACHKRAPPNAYVAVFSSAWFPNIIKKEEDNVVPHYRASGEPFRLFWCDAGKYDIALDNSHATVAVLKKGRDQR
jgi:hypothetical protein